MASYTPSDSKALTLSGFEFLRTSAVPGCPSALKRSQQRVPSKPVAPTTRIMIHLQSSSSSARSPGAKSRKPPCGDSFTRSGKRNRAASSTKNPLICSLFRSPEADRPLIAKDNLALLRIKHANGAQLTRHTAESSQQPRSEIGSSVYFGLNACIFAVLPKVVLNCLSSTDLPFFYQIASRLVVCFTIV